MNTVLILGFFFAITMAAESGIQKSLPPFSEGLVPLTDGRSKAVRYYVSTFETDAYTADLYCRQSGRQLLSIETDTEQRELVRFLGVNQITGCPWISATDISQEGVWVWGNGERVLYNNFVPGQADSTSANCLRIAGVDHANTYMWPKDDCRAQFTFICEV